MDADQMKWLRETLKIDVSHADVETDPGDELGFIPQSKGAQYEGEQNKAGWRADHLRQRPDETPEAYEQRKERFRETSHEVTRHYTDEEREAHTMRTDSEGIVRDSTGAEATGEHIYAVDAKTGELVVGKEGGANLRTLDDEGRPTDELKPSPSRLEGLAVARASMDTVRQELTHHTTMLRGEDVASAGVVKFEDGKVTKISNVSGHYKPQFVHLLQVVEHLLETGAMLDTGIVDYKGGEVETEHPKAFALYKKLQPVKAQLPADKKRIVQIVDALDKGKMEEGETTGLERERDRLMKKLELAQKGMAALGKMGIGPRNAMDWTTKVEMAFIEKDMTGLQAVTAKTEEMMVGDFVMGEGADDYLDERADQRRQEESEAAPRPAPSSYAASESAPPTGSGSPSAAQYTTSGTAAPAATPTDPSPYTTTSYGESAPPAAHSYGTPVFADPEDDESDVGTGSSGSGSFSADDPASGGLYNTFEPSDPSADSTDDSADVSEFEFDPTANAGPYNNFEPSDPSTPPSDDSLETSIFGSDDSDAGGPHNTSDPASGNLYNNAELSLTDADSSEDNSEEDDDTDLGFLGEDAASSNPYNNADLGLSGGTGPETDPASSAPTAPAAPDTEPAKPFRDFKAKGEMLDELRSVAKEKKLRPEDRDDLPEGSIAEGQAAELDMDAWSKEIDDIATELDDLIDDVGEDSAESTESAKPARVVGTDASGYAVFESSESSDPSAESSDPSTSVEPARVVGTDDSGYAVFEGSGPDPSDAPDTSGSSSAESDPSGYFSVSDPSSADPTDSDEPDDEDEDAVPKRQVVKGADGYVTYTSDDRPKD